MLVQENRAVGALVGSACGDSLGAPLEFLPPRNEPISYVKDMVGGGVLRWNPGDFTDDTIMSIAVSEMYLENKKYNQQILIKKWLKWAETSPKDIGNWTSAALRRWARYSGCDELRGENHPVIQMWRDKGSRDAGNGGVMRCMPTAIFEPDPNLRMADTIKICQDTHPDPRCIHSCIAVVEAINALIEGMPKENVIDYVLSIVGNSEVGEVLRESKNTPIHKCANSGYTVDTVKCAFAAFINADNFEDGLIAIVNRGNDADTVGAIAGSLLGAYYGFNSIPKRWLNKLKCGTEIEGMARQLFRIKRGDR